MLTARLTKKNDENVEIAERSHGQAHCCDDLDGADYVVSRSQRARRSAIRCRRSSPPLCSRKPSRKLRFSVKRTMMLAQRLYEGVELGKEGSVGLITYMRTDSTRVSNDALDEVRGMITERYGAEYRARQRPTSIRARRTRRTRTKPSVRRRRMRTPEALAKFLAEDELKLYRLIWMRFVASQMTPAVFDQTTIDVDAKGKRRRCLSVPRHRQRAEVRRLPEGLRGRQGPEGRGRRGAEAQAAGGDAKARS